jgi:PAP2 superfamily protein
MADSPNRTWQYILSLLLTAGVAGFAFNSYTYRVAMVSAFFSLALASVAILHFRVRPQWTDALLVLGCTALFAVVDLAARHFPHRIMAWFSFFGLGSLLVLSLRVIWAKSSDRKLLLSAWVPALLFIASEYFASTMLDWTAALHPKTLDLYLFSFDSSMGVQLSFLAGRWFFESSPLRAASLIFYIGLPIPIALIYAGLLIRHREKSYPAMLAFLVTGPLGMLFYNLYPAIGPMALFGQNFPFHPLPVGQAARLLLEPVALTGPRNAIPSLHMAWTLLAWWYSRGLSWWERAIALAFVLFTVLATLGTGEHYFVDLVVAFPFALFVQALCSYTLPWKDARRLAAISFGLLVTLAWLVALRHAGKFFWISPVIPWALCVATILLSSIRQHKFQLAVDSGPLAAELNPGVSTARQASPARN